jgi:hypothetical protein
MEKHGDGSRASFSWVIYKSRMWVEVIFHPPLEVSHENRPRPVKNALMIGNFKNPEICRILEWNYLYM